MRCAFRTGSSLAVQINRTEIGSQWTRVDDSLQFVVTGVEGIAVSGIRKHPCTNALVLRGCVVNAVPLFAVLIQRVEVCVQGARPSCGLQVVVAAVVATAVGWIGEQALGRAVESSDSAGAQEDAENLIGSLLNMNIL